MKYEAGQVLERWTPFILEDKEIMSFDPDIGPGSTTIKSWRPGTRSEPIGPEDARPVWDGDGAEIRTIVAIVKIDNRTTRILYRRRWRKPDGEEFGKNTVRMTTPSALSMWQSGRGSYYRQEIERWKEAAE